LLARFSNYLANSFTIIELKSLGVGTIGAVAGGAGGAGVSSGAKGTRFGYYKVGTFYSSIRIFYS
jgi:hypothetical protein